MSDLVRAFVAIELPEGLKEALVALQDRLGRKRVTAIKWVDPEGIHLTLKFLGYVGQDKIPEIVEAIKNASTDQKQLLLNVRGIGVFPNIRRPRVIWVGLDGEIDRLADLQGNIDERLVGLGFEKEERKFSPHLTLGRVKDKATPAEVADLAELIRGFQVGLLGVLAVNKISLMRSTLTPKGAIYDQIAAVVF